MGGMRALVANRYGPPADLVIADVANPSPGPGQVLIEVAAASVNPFDLQIVLGYLKNHLPVTFPYVVGMDCAGRVAAVGEGVTRFAVGDEVFGMLRETPGSVAELAVAPAASPLVERRPPGLDAVRAAAVAEVGMTALTLMRAATPRQSETVLILGASGGVGMVLVPLAAATGATVVATARAADATYVRGLGAAETVDHTAGDPVEETRRRHPDGVDVLFNLALDGQALADAARALRPGGRLVSARPIWDRSSVRSDVAVESPFLAAAPGDLADLAGKVVSGALRVEVQQVYPFEDAAQAFVDHMEAHSRGKRAIAIRDGS